MAIRQALRRPPAGAPDVGRLVDEVTACENPADAIPVLQCCGHRLLTDHAPAADAFLARARSIYEGRSLHSLAAMAMVTLGGEPMDTERIVCESSRRPDAVLHLRADEALTRCGLDIRPGWAAQTRRTAWATEPERRCAACATHAADEPACQETTVDILSAREQDLLDAAARRGLVGALAAQPPAIDNDPAARILRAADGAARQTLIDLACERAARHPRQAMDAILTPVDRDRLILAFGSVDAAPAPGVEELRAAQQQMLSRRLTPYEDDYRNASKALADALLAQRELAVT